MFKQAKHQEMAALLHHKVASSFSTVVVLLNQTPEGPGYVGCSAHCVAYQLTVTACVLLQPGPLLHLNSLSLISVLFYHTFKKAKAKL